MARKRVVARGLLAALSTTVVLVAGGCTQSPDDPVPSAAPTVSSAAPPPARSAAPDPATTPVPAPTPGDIESTEQPRKVERQKPVALDEPGSATDGVRVELATVEAIEAKASGPGEVAGPALRVDVRVRNTTAQPVDLAGAVVNLTDERGDPGSSMGAEPAVALPTSVAAGADVTGVYVFTVAAARRQPVTVDVELSADLPVVVFRGTA